MFVIAEATGSVDSRELAITSTADTLWEVGLEVNVPSTSVILGEGMMELVAAFCLGIKSVVCCAKVKLAMVDESVDVGVGVEATSELETGTATGQKVHNCLTSSQYKSTSSLRNPLANKLEMQVAASLSSYLRNEKHAAVKEMPGAVA